MATTEKDPGEKRGRGRPRLFDRSRALDRAMRLFWEQGYEGTTFEDLITAMSISPGSFYNAFQSKERLFLEATDHYLAEHATFLREALASDPDTRTAFANLFTASAKAFTRDDAPAGCLISLVGTHLPPHLASVHEAMKSYRTIAEVYLSDRLRAGVAAGDMPPDTNVGELAAFFTVVLRGMAVLARDGAPRERLEMIGRVGLLVWPADGLGAPGSS